MRPLWTGSLTFGLVNIPVRLHSAVQGKERVSFRLLHKTDLAPIRYERVCQKEGEAVDWKDIVKGYEYTKGKFVVLTDDDFKAASIESSKTIEIMDFVNATEIDPRYFETPYFVAPAKGGEKAYALLREAIKRTGMVGIGRITMRTNSLHLAGIKAVGEALVLEIMRFADEVIDVGEFSFPSNEGVRPQELQMAQQLVENLSQPFDPKKYSDDYHDNLMKIIRAKMK
jgi:DNA end-binding protein Ku